MTAIVLLPGMDGSGSLFSELVAALSASAEPVIVAYPPDRPLGYRDLEALAWDKLPSQPFILVGESFSGPIAVALSSGAPQDTPPCPPVPQSVCERAEQEEWLPIGHRFRTNLSRWSENQAQLLMFRPDWRNGTWIRGRALTAGH